MAAFPSHFRYSPESELLVKALTDDPFTIDVMIEHLSSTYPGIRQRMLEAVHNYSNEKIWVYLLNCFALGKWSDDHRPNIFDVPGVSQRLDVSIVDAFIEDCSDAESERKSTYLSDVINSQTGKLRNAAAYLAGLRGDADALPVLEEMLGSKDRLWQLRSIQALSAIKDKRSGDLLVHVLVTNHEQFHQEARRSLAELGELAEDAWLKALEISDSHIRWHAARGLAEIGNTSALRILANGLFNENTTVRWISSESLARVGAKAIPDILEVICTPTFSDECRQSAYHALRSIKTYRASECLKPLVSALSSPSTKQIAQIIARRMLSDWTRLEAYISGKTPSLENIN
jgi:HEAT repeat protein